MQIWLRRAYSPPTAQDGTRILVDRLWPRGVSREAARIDLWAREVAPSDGLRKWYNHEEERWPEFRSRYFEELKDREDALMPLRKAVKEGRVTLVFGAKDEERNNAVALKEYLEKTT